MQISVLRAEPPPPAFGREFLDGSHELTAADGDVWRYDASDRLTEIAHRDGSATVFEEDGVTLHFNPSGNLVWSIGLEARE
jgi:YD repeat-containing protein